ncbi:hypothetical protein BDR07DRAFT_1054774 [Suillus spraguei]|nr:hypothetical protein BDR07DRAFT_1054774 [Suillus spraguei]
MVIDQCYVHLPIYVTAYVDGIDDIGYLTFVPTNFGPQSYSFINPFLVALYMTFVALLNFNTTGQCPAKEIDTAWTVIWNDLIRCLAFCAWYVQLCNYKKSIRRRRQTPFNE